MKTAVVAASLAVGAIGAHAATVGMPSFTSSSGSTYDFDFAQASFAPEVADTLTITNTGYGYFHDHGYQSSVRVDVFNGSSWVNIFATPWTAGDAEFNLADVLTAPISFASMTISGVRLDSGMHVGYSFHNIDQSMTFAFDANGPGRNGVPEPASLALAGVALAGLAAARRKQAASQA